MINITDWTQQKSEDNFEAFEGLDQVPSVDALSAAEQEEVGKSGSAFNQKLSQCMKYFEDHLDNPSDSDFQNALETMEAMADKGYPMAHLMVAAVYAKQGDPNALAAIDRHLDEVRTNPLATQEQKDLAINQQKVTDQAFDEMLPDTKNMESIDFSERGERVVSSLANRLYLSADSGDKRAQKRLETMAARGYLRAQENMAALMIQQGDFKRAEQYISDVKNNRTLVEDKSPTTSYDGLVSNLKTAQNQPEPQKGFFQSFAQTFARVGKRYLQGGADTLRFVSDRWKARQPKKNMTLGNRLNEAENILKDTARYMGNKIVPYLNQVSRNLTDYATVFLLGKKPEKDPLRQVLTQQSTKPKETSLEGLAKGVKNADSLSEKHLEAMEKGVFKQYGSLPFEEYKPGDVKTLEALAQNGYPSAQQLLVGYYTDRHQYSKAFSMADNLYRNPNANENTKDTAKKQSGNLLALARRQQGQAR